MPKNSDYPWDKFDSSAYFSHNYVRLRHDDDAILRMVRDYFESQDLPNDLEGIDVGSGSNLYPALSLLPWCSSITLWEFATSNIDWLQNEVNSYSQSWDSFWETLQETETYRRVDDPRTAIRERVEVHKGSIFDLPPSRWDIGTLFFVAESLTEDVDEFHAAIKRFVGCLAPGGVFAAAFMEKSEGYDVGPLRFPAVSITKHDLESTFANIATDLAIHQIEAGSHALRPGYTGMLVALGRRTKSRSEVGGED